MNMEMVTRTIQSILVPVVLVTACGILLNGLLERYNSISTRIRTMTHERRELALGNDTSAAATERLKELDIQLPIIQKHHVTAHRSILAMYAAIAVFIAQMFITALGLFINTEAVATAALIVFLTGTGLVLISMFLTASEISTSQRALHFEVERVLKLSKQNAANTAKTS